MIGSLSAAGGTGSLDAGESSLGEEWDDLFVTVALKATYSTYIIFDHFTPSVDLNTSWAHKNHTCMGPELLQPDMYFTLYCV